MHLLFENVLKNLMLLWTAGYKGLDKGTGEYEVLPTIWDAIGAASATSGNTIPSAFGPRSPNVANDKTSWTADSRAFWSMYVAPVVLSGRFKERRYYDHFVRLVRLINLCLQFEITEEEVVEIRCGFAKWVQDYERLYYQHDPKRLSVCPLTIHALLHIADSIVEAGPVWTCWAFPMERYCGSLQGAIKSRRYPYASLNRYVLDRARLTQIKLRYDLAETLSMKPPSLHGFYRAACLHKTCAFLPPHRAHSDVAISPPLRTKIIGALCTRFNGTAEDTRAALAKAELEEWGRLRILPDADIIRAAGYTEDSNTRGAFNAERDATYVRYEALMDLHTRNHGQESVYQPDTFYGQLRRILTVHLPPIPNSSHTVATTLALAIIRECKIEEDHPMLDIHYYSAEGALGVFDITTVQCLVGRIKDRGRWGIIDRSGSLSRAIYNPDDEDQDE
ncbi:hypothetical protein C8Q80DRAFT_1311190 [Daedaleopsis nitida]|nr:hypothetical protein C8Q80DRAFT_1311190 [Daedaleopsis nitida]